MPAADQIETRPARTGDTEALLALMQSYYDEEGYPFAPARARAAVAALIADPRLGRLWLFEAAGRAVGYCAVTFGFSLEYQGRDAFLDEIYLSPAWRGQGVGGQALALAERACRAASIRALHLEVERTKSRLYSFYRRSGFDDHDRYLMTKRLGSAAVDRRRRPVAEPGAIDPGTGAIHHLDLTVSDLGVSTAFYDRLLPLMGFQRGDDVAEGPIWTGAQVEIGLQVARAASPSAHDRYSPGIHHLAFTAPTRAAVDALHQRLLEVGAPILDPPADYPRYTPGYYAVFFADPDGIKLEYAFTPRWPAQRAKGDEMSATVEAELPNVAELLGAVLQRVPREKRPLLIALAERLAAVRYRGWADDPANEAWRSLLHACAEREEEIARRVEAFYPDATAIQDDLIAANPDLTEINRSVFAGRSLAQQFTIQAQGERIGAATWRLFAEEEKNPAIRDAFRACARLEEESAVVLESILAS